MTSYPKASFYQSSIIKTCPQISANLFINIEFGLICRQIATVYIYKV